MRPSECCVPTKHPQQTTGSTESSHRKAVSGLCPQFRTSFAVSPTPKPVPPFGGPKAHVPPSAVSPTRDPLASAVSPVSPTHGAVSPLCARDPSAVSPLWLSAVSPLGRVPTWPPECCVPALAVSPPCTPRKCCRRDTSRQTTHNRRIPHKSGNRCGLPHNTALPMGFFRGNTPGQKGRSYRAPKWCSPPGISWIQVF